MPSVGGNIVGLWSPVDNTELSTMAASISRASEGFQVGHLAEDDSMEDRVSTTLNRPTAGLSIHESEDLLDYRRLDNTAKLMIQSNSVVNEWFKFLLALKPTENYLAVRPVKGTSI